MKAFAHLSPTVPAIFVAAMGISLSVFLLPGAGVQGEPTPLLAAIGGPAARVAADLPAAVAKRASEPVRRAAAFAQLAAARSEQFAPATKAHRAHRPVRSAVVRPAPSAPPQATAPAAPATPVTSSPTTATSKAHGHAYGRARESTAGATVPRAHGQGTAVGRSSDHHHGVPPGHAKKAPTAPPAAPTTTPPKVNGGGNGHKEGKK
jgi:hypothetical protein